MGATERVLVKEVLVKEVLVNSCQFKGTSDGLLVEG